MTIPATTQILDGKAVSKKMLANLTASLDAFRQTGGVTPKLVVVLVGDDPASQVYVGKKAQTAETIGMRSEIRRFPAMMPQAQLVTEIETLNADPDVTGILVQLPLPAHIDSGEVLLRVAPEKDVDGLHPLNLGKLVAGYDVPAKPCTPAGVITLLKHYGIEMAGRHAVVVGRSNIVGKPMGMLLLAENATVTYCHSKTPDLAAHTRRADILVTAVGREHCIGADHVKGGAVVVDVGINRTANGKLTGDVDFDAVAPKASYITPVPGGVGPMTIATLMANTLAVFQTDQR